MTCGATRSDVNHDFGCANKGFGCAARLFGRDVIKFNDFDAFRAQPSLKSTVSPHKKCRHESSPRCCIMHVLSAPAGAALSQFASTQKNDEAGAQIRRIAREKPASDALHARTITIVGAADTSHKLAS
jgi:hypothetical protein